MAQKGKTSISASAFCIFTEGQNHCTKLNKHVQEDDLLMIYKIIFFKSLLSSPAALKKGCQCAWF
jgi:hypothetical protein